MGASRDISTTVGGLIVRTFVIGILIAVASVVSVIGVFGLLFILLVPFAILYAFTASLSALRARKAAKKIVLAGRVTLDNEMEKIANFESAPQANSLVLNAILSVNLVASIVFALIVITNPAPDNGFFLGVWEVAALATGSAAMIGGVALAIANSPLLYKPDFLRAEEYALQKKSHAWKLIRLNHIWSWVIWGVYPITAVIMVDVLYLNSGLA